MPFSHLRNRFMSKFLCKKVCAHIAEHNNLSSPDRPNHARTSAHPGRERMCRLKQFSVWLVGGSMSCRGGRPHCLPPAIRSLSIYRPSPANPNKTRVDFPEFFWNAARPEAYQGAKGKGNHDHGSPTMSEQVTFAEFLRRLRAGDEQATVDLLRRYEGIIRRAARLQITDPGLGCATR